MSNQPQRGEFPHHAGENRRIWNANAQWWDDHIGDGNDHQVLLIEPASERLLRLAPGQRVLDIACGAGRFARRMAEVGAQVTAIDHSPTFIERARSRTPANLKIDYRVLDAADPEALGTLPPRRFDRVVCTMALMDMPCIAPLMQAIPRLLTAGGAFVFSLMHPCFNSNPIQRFCEAFTQPDGRAGIRNGVKVSLYHTPLAYKDEGIIGQPEPQFYFHRPLHVLLEAAFAAGLVMDGLEEPAFPAKPQAMGHGFRWNQMPEIPPVLAVRMRMGEQNR